MPREKDERLVVTVGLAAACACTGLVSAVLARQAMGHGLGPGWLSVLGPAIAYVSWYVAGRRSDGAVVFVVLAALCFWVTAVVLNLVAALLTGQPLAHALFLLKTAFLFAVPVLAVIVMFFAALRIAERRSRLGYRAFPVVGAALGALLGGAQYVIWASVGRQSGLDAAAAWVVWQAASFALLAVGASLAAWALGRPTRSIGD